MRIILVLAVLSSPALFASATRDPLWPEWPAVTQEAKPWAYNWWMASAVDAEGLEHQCAEMEEAGFAWRTAVFLDLSRIESIRTEVPKLKREFVGPCEVPVNKGLDAV